MSDAIPPARVRHEVHLLPQDTTSEELHALVDELQPRKTAFTYSADVVHAIIEDGLPGSFAVIWDADRWIPKEDGVTIQEWMEARGIDYKLRDFASILPDDGGEPDPPPAPSVTTLVGLHARADPHDLPEAEYAVFRVLRPGVIKVLSAHPRPSILRLAAENRGCKWIVRAFLDFGGRNVMPSQFYADTRDDMRRTLDALDEQGVPRGDILIELHNEPNLYAEGYGRSWNSGAEFGDWLRAVISMYRANFGGYALGYPGLSPGFDIAGIRAAMDPFIRQSRETADACDAVCFHDYWSNQYKFTPPGAVAYWRKLFPGKPLWATEVSRNDRPSQVSVTQRAKEYANYVRYGGEFGLKGVTFFVASASNGAYEAETWVTEGGVLKGIAAGVRADLSG